MIYGVDALQIFIIIIIIIIAVFQANDRGDYFPLWGTCQGFQVMVCDVANANVLNHTDSYNMAIPLELMPGQFCATANVND